MMVICPKFFTQLTTAQGSCGGWMVGMACGVCFGDHGGVMMSVNNLKKPSTSRFSRQWKFIARHFL